MTDDVINHIVQILLPVLGTAITGLVSWIGISLKNTFEKKVKSETIKMIANDTVKYVEQVYYKLQGPEKLNKAISTATEILNEKGIKISNVELYTMIESAVNGLNHEQNMEIQDQENVKENIEG